MIATLTHPKIDNSVTARSPRNAALLADSSADRATIVTDEVYGRKFVVIPIEPDIRGVDTIGLTAAGSHIAQQELERHRLEAERDALADQLAQNFEELHWLRNLATLLTVGDTRSELQCVANTVLPNLREILRC